MKKLSKINESVWGDIRRRAEGQEVRKEDRNSLKDAFHKMKEMTFIYPKRNWSSGVDFEWAPCNLGAESYDQPGLWLTSEDILELNDMLKDTGYMIAGSAAFGSLSSRTFEKKKIGKTWYLIFGEGSQRVYIPNFGYYSEGLPDKPIKPTGKDHTPYGCMHIGKAGYAMLWNAGQSYLSKVYINSNQGDTSDKFQVRLVKRIS